MSIVSHGTQAGSHPSRNLLRQFLEHGKHLQTGIPSGANGLWSAGELKEIARNLGRGLKKLIKDWQEDDTTPPDAEIECALIAIQLLGEDERQAFLPAIHDAVILRLLARRLGGQAFGMLPVWQESLLRSAGVLGADQLWGIACSWVRFKEQAQEERLQLQRDEIKIASLPARLNFAVERYLALVQRRIPSIFPAPSRIFDALLGRVIALHQQSRRAIDQKYLEETRPNLHVDGRLIFDLTLLPFEADDHRLVAAWLNDEATNNESSSDEVSRKEQRRRLALYAARLAERCVGIWLTNNRGIIEDISILQVREPDRRDWTLGDLRTPDGAIFDVKNSVRHQGWMETQINRMKVSPNGTAVTYVATYTKLDPDEDGGSRVRADDRLAAKLGIIGTATQHSLRSLIAWAAESTPRVSLMPVQVEDFRLAPFYFDLEPSDWPEPVRSARQNGIAWAQKGWTHLGLKCAAPLALAARLPAEAVSSEANRLALYQWFLDRLRTKQSLGAVYLTLLDHFVSHYSDGRIIVQGEPMQIEQYRELLLPDLPGIESGLLPAWQWDATGIVARALRAIGYLLRAKVRLPRIQRLYVTSQGVVSATTAPNSETATRRVTLLAHCSNCGTFPLLYGREKSCSGCGRLICTRFRVQHGCTCGQSVGLVESSNRLGPS